MAEPIDRIRAVDQDRSITFMSKVVRDVPCAHNCGKLVELTEFGLAMATKMNRVAKARGIVPMPEIEMALCGQCYEVHADDLEETARRMRVADLEKWGAYRQQRISAEVLLQSVNDRPCYRELVKRCEAANKLKSGSRRGGAASAGF